MPPSAPVSPPFYGQPQQQGQFLQGQPSQGIQPPPAGGGYGGYAPPPPAVMPQSTPGQHGTESGEMPPDVDAILRGAADNLSSEMFSDKDDDDPLGG